MKKTQISDGSHTWRFFRSGGFDQVRLDSAQDLLAIDKLDQKIWVALACPIDNVIFDARTLALIDTDGDRRIRPAELIAAIKWTASLLKNPDDLVNAPREFSLQVISEATDEGRALAAAARSAVAALGKQETDPISVSEIESLETILARKPFNGDGVVTEEATTDETLRIVIKEIIAALGATADRSGNPGVDIDKVKTFFTQVRAHEAWQSEADKDASIRPLGATTEKAGHVLAEVRNKIDDYFTRCAVAGFDGQATVLMNGSEHRYATMTGKTLSLNSNEIAELPLAPIQAGRPLTLRSELNPAWVGRIADLDTSVVRPLLGTRESLSQADWQGLLTTFEPWFAWLKRKPAIVLDALSIDRVRKIANDASEQALLDLIERDTAESATFASLGNLEKLVRFRRDLHALCSNFVNFRHFYSRGGSAIFQAGTLFLDQRSCSLCIKVDDANKHCLMAAMAGTYLMYCECRRRAGIEKMMIAAAVTNGDSENLIVGRNGVFYDRVGNDWDATIVKIIENPISLRQAFWLPYKNLVRMIESQVAKRATAADAQSGAKLEQTAASAANVDKSAPPPPPKKLDIGVVAALGVAAGALGTFLATILGYVGGIVQLGPLAIVGALIGVLLLISGPSLILAFIKLRKRNLGPILDASGWAINAKARISVPFGAELTRTASLPPGAQRDLLDPYAEKKSPWPKVVVIAILLYAAWAALDHLGFVNEWTGGRLGKPKEVSAQTQDGKAPEATSVSSK